MTRPRSDLYWVMPRRWFNKPPCQAVIDGYKDDGYLDDDGNITPLGKEHGLVTEELLGTETREHYEEYRKHWDAFAEKFDRWANDESIPEDEEPNFDYVEVWPSEQEEQQQKEQAAQK